MRDWFFIAKITAFIGAGAILLAVAQYYFWFAGSGDRLSSLWLSRLFLILGGGLFIYSASSFIFAERLGYLKPE